MSVRVTTQGCVTWVGDGEGSAHTGENTSIYRETGKWFSISNNVSLPTVCGHMGIMGRGERKKLKVKNCLLSEASVMIE